MTLLRRELGAALRRRREQQHRTLRDVAHQAGVSLGYLSEVERGIKEASSELLAAICTALQLRLADLLAEVAVALDRADGVVLEPVPASRRVAVAASGPALRSASSPRAAA